MYFHRNLVSETFPLFLEPKNKLRHKIIQMEFLSILRGKKPRFRSYNKLTMMAKADCYLNLSTIEQFIIPYKGVHIVFINNLYYNLNIASNFIILSTKFRIG